MTDRYTKKEMEKLDDIDFAICILNDRRNKCTNFYSLLSQRLQKSVLGLRELKNQKEKIINLIEEKMKEHNEQEHCTDYDVALQIFESNAERGIDKIYDAGRYEAFIEILNSIKEIKYVRSNF